jgi:hypothetical protein
MFGICLVTGSLRECVSFDVLNLAPLWNDKRLSSSVTILAYNGGSIGV